MAIYFRGAGPGTYWAVNDAVASGFQPTSLTVGDSPHRLMQHIEGGRVGPHAYVASPYISLTNSQNVAWVYAISGKGFATKSNPGYIYEVEIDDPPAPLPAGIQRLIDPIKDVAGMVPSPPAPIAYQHNDFPGIILAVAAPRFGPILARLGMLGPLHRMAGKVNFSTLTTLHFRALVRALRDAEVLVHGYIPKSCVKARHAVY